MQAPEELGLRVGRGGGVPELRKASRSSEGRWRAAGAGDRAMVVPGLGPRLQRRG